MTRWICGTWLENYRTLNYTMSLALNQVYETPEIPVDFHAAGGPLGDRSYAVGLNAPEIETAIAQPRSHSRSRSASPRCMTRSGQSTSEDLRSYHS
jgi:hypothetical protein